MTLYRESVADQTDHFANVFVREDVVYAYDVVTLLCRSKYTADVILFRETQSKRIDN